MYLKDIATPALILDLDAFDRNLERLSQFCSTVGLAMRPHYKSHKCATIAHRQIARGAIGLCTATLSEAEDLADSGIDNILIANQVIGRRKVARAAQLATACHLTVCVDDSKNVEDLQQMASYFDTKIHCLIEYDVGMNRCGVRTREEFLSLTQQISKCSHLSFSGIQAYAGHLAHVADEETRRIQSQRIEDDLRALKHYIENHAFPVNVISGISTGTILFKNQSTVYTEMQAGSYIFMDAAYGELHLNFEHALFILTSIMTSGDGHTVTDVGLKSASTDQKLPYFVKAPDAVLQFSEEHCAANRSLGEVEDLLLMIPGHCCTTVNLYDWIHFVKDGRLVEKVPITSRGKSW